jgi:hypothetical protein
MADETVASVNNPIPSIPGYVAPSREVWDNGQMMDALGDYYDDLEEVKANQRTLKLTVMVSTGGTVISLIGLFAINSVVRKIVTSLQGITNVLNETVVANQENAKVVVYRDRYDPVVDETIVTGDEVAEPFDTGPMEAGTVAKELIEQDLMQGIGPDAKGDVPGTNPFTEFSDTPNLTEPFVYDDISPKDED